MQSNYLKLAEVVEEQSKVIAEQADLINELIQDNAEKENLINVLMQENEKLRRVKCRVAD